MVCPKTSYWQKALLIIFGLSIAAILLEVGLRIGGFAIISYQNHRNKLSIRQKGTYSILCLGESTTQNQYPPFLQEILNQQNTGIRFSVIDKGVSGTNMVYILDRLESYLNEYHPDMVVTMMGINESLSAHIPHEKPSSSKAVLFLRSFRTYKLARLLWLHMVTKAREISLYKSQMDKQPFNELKSNPVTIGVKERDLEGGDVAKSEEALKKAIELNPKYDRAYVELGWLCYNRGQLQQAEKYLKKAIELNPNNDGAYVVLGWLYYNRGQLQQAEKYLKKAIELNPNNDRAYVELVWLYYNRGQLQQAEKYLKKAIELNPKNDRAYVELGWLCYNRGQLQQAEEYFKKAIELNLKKDRVYLELVSLYYNQGHLQQAKELLRKALELDFHNLIRDRFYGALAVIDEEIGEAEHAREYSNKANELRLTWYDPIAAHSYRKLQEILDRRNIKLVCVQYPMLSVEPLRRVFAGEAGIIFVDNERLFREAVKREGYKEYFKDMFGGDFGHCTPKGNRILADNIAKEILNEFSIH